MISITRFTWKNIFETLHSETFDSLWRSESDSAGKYGVCTSHPTYTLLQSKYEVDFSALRKTVNTYVKLTTNKK